MVIRNSHLVVTGIVAGICLGCTVDRGLVTEPRSREAREVRQDTMDDEFRRLAQTDIPGFAGYHLDEAGALIVSLTPGGSLDSAVRVLAARPMHAGRLKGRPVRAREVRYDFEQLTAWLGGLERTLVEAGVEMADVDELENRLWLGVVPSRSSTIPWLTAAIAAEGIPADAAVIEVVEPTTIRHNLQDRAPVLAGGFQIQHQERPPCTLGFAAVKDGISGFITASHCSSAKFAPDGLPFYQPLANGRFPAFGLEVTDPAGYRCAGPLNAPCRYSDATFARLVFPMPFELGLLVRTRQAGIDRVGSLEQDPASPYWLIYHKHASVSTPVGLTLHKVGATTGWTTGTVTRSCVRFPAMQLRCQVVSTILSSGGDSGAPVFHRFAMTSFVALYGVLWGGPGENFRISYHSSIAGIEVDMGKLDKVCLPAYSC